MEKKEQRELSAEAAAKEEINEADGLPIYHANEGEGEAGTVDEMVAEADDENREE